MKYHSEPLYNNQQIFIPPAFPHVLKVYAKAAIRTQPYDLLTWSASYFRALADGRSPPVKTRIEYPLIKSKGGLSPGYLKLLIKQFSESVEVERDVLWKRWTGVCLKENELKQILCLGGLYNDTNIILYKFVAIAAGFLCKSLTQTMIMLCELFTDEPDGGSSAISSDLFIDLYTFLSAIDASKEQKFYDGHLKVSVLQKSDTVVENLDSSDIDAWQAAIESEIISDSDDKNKQDPIVSDDSASVEVKCDDEKNYIDEFIAMEKHEIEIESNLPLNNENISKCDELSGLEEENINDIPIGVENDDITSENKSDDSTDEKESNFEKNQYEDEEGVTSPIVKRTVTLRVFSEDGEKIASSSVMSIHEEESPVKFLQIDPNGELFIPKKDVSIEDREAIIEKLQKAQDEKVKNLEAVMDSVENLAEKARNLSHDADILSNQKAGDVVSIDSEKIQVDPNAKGVVNPVFKGLFDNVADKMCIVRAFHDVKPIVEQEIIIVPHIPGIGPVIDEDMVEEFLKYVRETAADQCDMFMPRDIRHYFCPPLEKI